MGPMLEGAKNRLEATGWKEPLKDKKVSADTGYYSVKNPEACRDLGVDAYVPDPQFRKRDIRFADAGRHRRSVDRRHERYKSKKRWFSVEDFKLDDHSGKLICPAGKYLYVKNRNFITPSGYRAIAYQAPESACRDCRKIKVNIQCLVHNIEKIMNPGRTCAVSTAIAGEQEGNLPMKTWMPVPGDKYLYE